MTVRVIVAEDHPLVLGAIVDHLKKQEEIEVVATSANGPALLSLVREHQPDVVLLDLGMPDFDPVISVKTILREYPGMRCVVLTGEDNPYYIHAMMDAGIHGYILKSDDLSLSLAYAVLQVHEGKYFLSPEANTLLLGQKAQAVGLTKQEIQALGLMAYGYQNNCIAEMMGVSSNCVRHLLADAYKKLGVREDEININSRVAAVRKAQQIGVLPSPG